MTTGYLAVALFHRPRGNTTDMVMAFEPTEDAARDKAQRLLDENRLEEHGDVREELQIFAAKEVRTDERFSYADEDVLYADDKQGCWVKPDAQPNDCHDSRRRTPHLAACSRMDPEAGR